MNTGTLIKDIIEKIKLWLKNFLNKKKQNIKKKQAPLKEKDKQKKVYLNKLAFDNGNKSANVGTIYPKLSKKNLELLNKKTMNLKNKIIDLENNNNNIKIINSIIDEINQNDLYINQAIKINHLLNEINEDNDLNLNTNEKLNILKDNISLIIDKKLDDYENDIIKKAYNEYNQVNYVIMTSLMIDDIINEINELTNDFEKNKYSKAEYERRINKIKDKIDKL